VEIDMRDSDGQSVFGRILQSVRQYRRGG